MEKTKIEIYRKGFDYLESNDLDCAKKYFEGQDINDPVVKYGLAVTTFKQEGIHLSMQDTTQVIRLLEEAISEDDSFADAYHLCALGYDQLASLKLRLAKKDPSSFFERKEGIRGDLEHALNLLSQASLRDKSFQHLNVAESRRIQGSISGLENLQEYYTTHPSSK